MNPYDVMGLPRNASEEDVKKRYRALVKQFHDVYTRFRLLSPEGEDLKLAGLTPEDLEGTI